MIDTCANGEGRTLFRTDQTHPPPAEVLHVALQKLGPAHLSRRPSRTDFDHPHGLRRGLLGG